MLAAKRRYVRRTERAPRFRNASGDTRIASLVVNEHFKLKMHECTYV